MNKIKIHKWHLIVPILTAVILAIITLFLLEKKYTFIQDAWLPNSKIEAGIISLEKGNTLTSISPIWYEINNDGSLLEQNTKNINKLKAIVTRKNMRLTPSVALFEDVIFSNIFSNEKNLDRHINAILDEVEKYNFDGIDLDYEISISDNEEKYFKFLKTLSKKLHKHKKILSVTVPAKWENPKTQNKGLYNWKRISKYADEIRIMAYGYTYSRSKYPRPIAPNDLVEKMLEHAVSEIPKHKIILGIHLYGYEWRDKNKENVQLKNKTEKNSRSKKATTKSYTHNKILEIIAKYKNFKPIKWEGESVFQYTVKRNNKPEYRTIIYADKNTVNEKIELAKKYGIRGVCYWRLGDEGDLIE